MKKKEITENKQNLMAEKMGLELRRENIENAINGLEEEIVLLKQESKLSKKQQEQIIEKIDELLLILGIDTGKDTTRLYKERELENLNKILTETQKRIHGIEEKLILLK